MRFPRHLPLCLFLLAPPASAIVPAGEAPSRSEWFVAMRESRDQNLSFKVMRTRALFNSVAWRANAHHNGRWKSPTELLDQGAGNLLDLVAAYYFTLRGMGVEADDIRLYVGKMRTLDKTVPHILLAIRNHGPTYYVDPLLDIPMIEEPPAHFRPMVALNESGTWRTGALTDTSVWSAVAGNAAQIQGWSTLCDDTLILLGLRQSLPTSAPPPTVINEPAGKPATVKSRKRRPDHAK